MSGFGSGESVIAERLSVGVYRTLYKKVVTSAFHKVCVICEWEA